MSKKNREIGNQQGSGHPKHPLLPQDAVENLKESVDREPQVLLEGQLFQYLLRELCRQGARFQMS